VRVSAVVADRFEEDVKKSLASLISVIGVIGDASDMDELSEDMVGVFKKLRSMLEKSESLPELIDDPEEALSELMSG